MLILRDFDDDVIKNFVTIATVDMVNDRAFAKQLLCKVSSR